MKHLAPRLIVIAALAALAACTTTQGPPSGGGYLPGQGAPTGISEVEAETLTSQYREYKLKREEISAAMAGTSDPNARAYFANIINDLTRSMEPLAYRLRSAGRPLP